MEVVFFQNEAFTLQDNYSSEQAKNGKKITKTSATLRLSRIPLVADRNLRKILGPIMIPHIGSTIIIEVGSSDQPNHYTSLYKGFLRIRDNTLNGVLQTLSYYCEGGLKLSVDLNLNNLHGSGINWNKQELDVIRSNTLQPYGVEKHDDWLSLNYQQWLYLRYHRDGQNPSGTVTITAILPKSFCLNQDEDTTIADKLCINKKILLEEIGCDVVIISENGAKIKCHKSFLIAHSAVFQTMFQSSMKEAKTSTVEILDMTEESVRALLAYLYFWEIKQAENNSLICFELLNAGHKYDIASLENCMTIILLKNDIEWFDVDVAIRLFVFSRNLPEGEKLKMKAIQVLKSKISILKESECYQELFRKDHKAAMDLCKYAFSL